MTDIPIENPAPETAAPEAAAPAKRGRPPASGKISFRIERAVWDGNGNRIDEGSIVEMTAEEALAGIESGALKRATPEEIAAAKA